nr:helix-turn-helix domain-containing protein [Arthrobacter silviterrae]
MVYQAERPLLGAHVSGVAAQWISVRLPSEAVDDTCRNFQANGKPELALELRQTMAGIRAAAAVYIERRNATTSASGSAELPPRPVTKDSNHEYLSVADAAIRLGLSERRVRQILSAGRMPGYRQARQWVIDPQALEDYKMGRTN